MLKPNKETKLLALLEKFMLKKELEAQDILAGKHLFFVGGGIAHGPKGDNYKTKRINKKIRKLALAQTISKKNINKDLNIFEDVKKQISTILSILLKKETEVNSKISNETSELIIKSREAS